MMKYLFKILISIMVMAIYIGELHAMNYQLDNIVSPTSQKVSLILNPNNKGFTGSTRITLLLNESTTNIRLYSKDIKISKASISAANSSNIIELMIGKANEFDILSLESSTVLSKGQYFLEIVYSGSYRNDGHGLYKFNELGVDYLATQFQAMKARTVFPSFDEPKFKIPFQFNITSPIGLQVLAGAPINRIIEKDKTSTHIFEQTAPINTDILAFSVGLFDQIEISGLAIPSSIYVTKGKSNRTLAMKEAIPQLFHHVQSYFISDFPYQKLDFLVLPHYDGAGMENVGLITLNENLVLSTANQPKENLYELYKLLAHEIAHMWFGNLVTMRWWDDLWLNESFADWLARKIVLANFAEIKGVLKLPQLDAFWDDGPQNPAIKRKMISVADYDAVGQIVYTKGHALIAMVESYVGEEKFRKAIIAYIKKFSGGNVSYTEFIEHIERYTETSLKGIFKSFLTQSGYPLVTLKVKNEQLEVSQHPFVQDGIVAPLFWHVPLQLKFLTPNGVQTTSILLDKPKITMMLPKGVFTVFPDAKALGYYRYQVISNKSENIQKQLMFLTDKEKASWLANNSDLVRGGYKNYADVLKLQVKLLNDTTLNTQITSDIIRDLINNFDDVISLNLHPSYVNYLTEKLPYLQSNIRWLKQEKTAAEDNTLMARSLTLLGKLNNKKAIELAKAHYQPILDGKSSLNTTLQNAILNVMSSVSGEVIFEQYKNAYILSNDENHKAQLIRYMGYFSFRGSVKLYYDFLLSDEVADKDFRGYYFQYPVYNPINRLTAINYLEGTADKLFDKVSEGEKQWQPYSFASGCSATLQARLNDIFTPYVKKIKGLKEKLNNVNNMIEQCTKAQKNSHVELINLFTI